MNNQELMQAAAARVQELNEANTHSTLPYHNLRHTKDVVKATQQIADHYQLNETDYATVYIAAWFHDTGYLLGPPEGHEEKGATLAAEFLTGHGADEAVIAKVRSAILATKIPQQPVTLLDQIVCDADLFHFGTNDFKDKNKLMRKEIESRIGKELEGDEWRASSIKLLEDHHFHTDYCKVLLQKGKQDNLDRLLEKAQKKEEKEEAKVLAIAQPEKVKEEPSKKKKEKEKASKGVETMYRIASSNHLRLSSMADNKAHIMITVNSIIVSVLISTVVRKLDNEPYLLIPCIILLTFSMITIVFAILVTRPNVTRGISTREDIEQKKSNLLFFGNFYNMRQEDYEWGMKEMRKDEDFAYDSMSRDVYFLGKVLGRKYKLLHKAYTFFMFGFIISIISFLVATVAFGK